jgi:hypothetical protein
MSAPHAASVTDALVTDALVTDTSQLGYEASTRGVGSSAVPQTAIV